MRSFHRTTWFAARLTAFALLVVTLLALRPVRTAASTTTTTYPTTCQWNGCPQTGLDVCFVANNGHYICSKPWLTPV